MKDKLNNQIQKPHILIWIGVVTWGLIITPFWYLRKYCMGCNDIKPFHWKSSWRQLKKL
jgi:hypothetical protein